MITKAEQANKVKRIKEEIIKISSEYMGQFYSNEKNRKLIVNAVDGLNHGTLLRYIRILKTEGFLVEDTANGRGWHFIKETV